MYGEGGILPQRARPKLGELLQKAGAYVVAGKMPAIIQACQLVDGWWSQAYAEKVLQERNGHKVERSN